MECFPQPSFPMPGRPGNSSPSWLALRTPEWIPYIASKPNFPGAASHGNPNILWQLLKIRHLAEIGFVWVRYGPELA
jgi:hypothetical protein